MRKITITALLCAMMALPVFAEDVVYLTTQEFRNRIFDYKKEREWTYRGDKPCIIDFYTTWCGPCKRLAPIMEELSQTYCDQVVFYKADTERERELAYVFGISSIPQVLYIPMNGKPLLLKGLYPKEEIVRIIDEFLLHPQVIPQPEVKEDTVPVPEEPRKKPTIKEKIKYRVKHKKK